MIKMNEYRLLTTRTGEGDSQEYEPEVSFNGQRIDVFPDSLRDIWAEQSLTHVKYLAKHPDLRSVEFKISRDGLK